MYPKATLAMKDRDKVGRLEAHGKAIYENIPLDLLAVFAVGQLEKIKADLSFENAVVACFKLFPQKFALSGFQNYPDSDRVRNCLNRCTLRSKQWLGGKALYGFQITDRARVYLQEAEQLLSGKAQRVTKAPSQTRRKEAILNELRAAPAYVKYQLDKKDEINESELCYALQGTLDSSRNILKNNLETLMKYAEDLQDKNSAAFLAWLNKRFETFLNIDRG